MSPIPKGSLALVTAMAMPIYVSPPLEEVQAAGLMLLEDFVEDQFQNADLPSDAAEIMHSHGDFMTEEGAHAQGDEVAGAHGGAPNGAPNDALPSTVFASLPEGFTDPNLKDIGKILKECSKKFSTSHERFLIRLLANNVSLESITFESFSELLRELFSHGVTEGCIVALFFFCSDVLIRCARSGMVQKGRILFTWMQQFLIRKVCQWVFEKGGWEKVLSSVYSIALKVAAFAAVGLLVISIASYLKNK